MQEIIYHTNFKLEDQYWWFVARNQIIKKAILDFIKLNKNNNLLDVGCGTGAFAAEMNQKTNVIALDTSPIALEYCSQRGIEQRFNCLLNDFPKDKFRIDAITFLDVIEHIQDDYQIVKDAYNIIENNGYVIASVPAYQWLWSHHDELHMHYRRYTKSQIEKVFKSANFQIIYSSYFNTLLFPIAVLKRFVDKITGADKKNTSPIEEVSPTINKLFKSIFMYEKNFIPKLKLPFGLSILIVAKKI